jgi:hypothetical protein
VEVVFQLIVILGDVAAETIAEFINNVVDWAKPIKEPPTDKVDDVAVEKLKLVGKVLGRIQNRVLFRSVASFVSYKIRRKVTASMVISWCSIIAGMIFNLSDDDWTELTEWVNFKLAKK